MIMIIAHTIKKMNQKKQYSLSVEAYEKLQSIAKRERRTMSATIELLILEKYQTLENQYKELSPPKTPIVK